MSSSFLYMDICFRAQSFLSSYLTKDAVSTIDKYCFRQKLLIVNLCVS